MSGQTDNHVYLFFDEIVLNIDQDLISYIYFYIKLQTADMQICMSLDKISNLKEFGYKILIHLKVRHYRKYFGIGTESLVFYHHH